MTGLLLSNNYVLTYAFWEGVGVCSYLLIGFWYQKPSAAAAAKKAFLVNRIGDVGFAIAIFWLWTISQNHDLSYTSALSHENLSAHVTEAAALGIGLLLFWAATAKSAQLPLYVWLPDAMEGPTPVSALHSRGDDGHRRCLPHRALDAADLSFAAGRSRSSASSVARRRSSPALIALTQTDLKRVLAYSTVSQLGFMFMGLGAGIGGAAALGGVRGDVSLVHARLLQSAVVPRFRLGHARDGRRDRHATLRRLTSPSAIHVLDVPRRHAGPLAEFRPWRASSARTKS